MTAHANARALYQQRKKHEAKESKTVQASQRALKQAEKQASTQMKKLKVTAKPGFKVARKQYWFEKFDWFVSSENYLVVSGRDAQILRASRRRGCVQRHTLTDDVPFSHPIPPPNHRFDDDDDDFDPDRLAHYDALTCRVVPVQRSRVMS